MVVDFCSRALSFLLLGSLATIGLWSVAPAQPVPGGVCKPVSERTTEIGCWIIAHEPVGQFNESSVFWHLDAYPTRAAAQGAKGAQGTVVESFGKVWLLTIAEEGWRPQGGERVAANRSTPYHWRAEIVLDKDRSVPLRHHGTHSDTHGTRLPSPGRAHRGRHVAHWSRIRSRAPYRQGSDGAGREGHQTGPKRSQRSETHRGSCQGPRFSRRNVAGWKDRVRAAAEGAKIHVAIDSVGGRLLGDVADLLAERTGTVINFGSLGGETSDIRLFPPRSLTLKGVALGSWMQQPPEQRKADIALARRLAHEPGTLFEVAERYSPSRIADAVTHVSQADRAGVVLIDFSKD